MKVETNKVVEIKAKYLTTEEYDQLMAMIKKNNDGNSQYFANTTGINMPSSKSFKITYTRICVGLLIVEPQIM